MFEISEQSESALNDDNTSSDDNYNNNEDIDSKQDTDLNKISDELFAIAAEHANESSNEATILHNDF